MRKRVRTRDGVNLSVIDVGDPAKPAIVFVHGLSQSALSWRAQLTAGELLAGHRLVAVDLRGHGLSQGAFDAMADDGAALPLLADSSYAVADDPDATSRLWANDVEAAIEGLSLSSPALVGWSYGAAVVVDYLGAHGGLGEASKVLLIGGTPVLLPPGTGGGGGADEVFGAEVPGAVFKTLDVNPLADLPAEPTFADVVAGMAEFVELTLRDRVPGRAAPSREEIVAATAYNVLLPPPARRAIVGRMFDHRPFLASLPSATKQRMRVISGSADAVIQAANAQTNYAGCGLEGTTFEGEGHSLFARNPALFNVQLLDFIAA